MANTNGANNADGARVTSTSANIVTDPVSIGKITLFDWTKYEATGRSSGHVFVAGDGPGGVWIGTDFRVRPVLDYGVVRLGTLPRQRNTVALTRADVAEGAEIVLLTEISSYDGSTFTRWCLVHEWNAAVEHLRDRLTQWEEDCSRAERQAAARAQYEADCAKERGYIEFTRRPLKERIVDGMVLAQLLRGGNDPVGNTTSRGNGRQLEHRARQ